MTGWYLARAAGLTALLLLTVSTCLGAAMSRRGGPAGVAALRRRYLLQYVHRVVAGLGLLALALHLSLIATDAEAHVGWRGALLPFTADYRPGWVALGTLAAYTFLMAALLGLARGRLAAAPAAARLWRGLHCLAYAAWAMAIAHGFRTGTDSAVGWVRVLYLGCIAAVLGGMAVRLSTTGGGVAGPSAAAGVRDREPVAALPGGGR